MAIRMRTAICHLVKRVWGFVNTNFELTAAGSFGRVLSGANCLSQSRSDSTPSTMTLVFRGLGGVGAGPLDAFLVGFSEYAHDRYVRR